MYKLLVLATLLGGALADHDSKHQEELPSACRMSPDTSDCGGSEQRWFYYADLKMCTEFTYKGCGKTENNFATRDDCEKLCLEKTETESTKTSEASEQSQIPEESVNKEKEQSDNTEPDVPKTKETILENVKGSDEDEEEIEEKLKEQEEIQQRFNMANHDDLLTLEEYMQDENIDMADILEAAEAGDITDEDIKANLYTGDESEYGEKEEDHEKESENDMLPTESETDKLPTESEKTDKLPTESDTLKEDDDVGNGQNDDTSDETYMQQQIEEEGELQERFNMANSEDMLALQGIVQDPGMEVGDIEKQNNNEGQAKGDVSPPENEGNEDTLELDIEGDLSSDYTDGFPSKITIGIDTDDLQRQQPEDFQPNLYYSNSDTDEDEDVVDATQRRQQFEMADSDDYVTLEDLMSNPNMEIIKSENRYAPNGAMETSQIRYDDNQEMNSENEKVDPFKEDKQDLQDTYGEHLDYNHPEISKDEEEAEIDDTINFETELEQKFDMADREDILSLEKILQDQNTEVAEVIPSQNAGNTQDSDVKGVLSLAASFLGDNSNEEKDQLKEFKNDMQHLPYIARKPFEEAAEEIHGDLNNKGVTGDGNKKQNTDYTHPAELLKRQQMKKEKQLVTPPINIQSMAHDDKMMLMSLLHVDRLKFHRLAQTTPSLLDLVKEERKKKLLHNDVSPNEGFIDIVSKKDGIKKCCLLHKDPGPCQDKTLQWHYDPVLHTCLPFFYGGCEGNKNRFDTIGECLRKCGFNDQEKRKSSPEPIPEPPTYSKNLSSRNGFKAVISKLLPGKMLSLRDRMTPGQQKFIHKFIKSAINHVSDIKPVKIGQLPLAFGKYKVPENMVDRRNRLPMPIKSILFKWPILRMVFDRTIKDIKPMRDMQEMSEPMDNILPMFPREFKEYRRLDKEWDKGSRGDFKDFRKMGRDRSDFRNYKKLDRGNRENREEFGDSKKIGRFWGRDSNHDEPKGRRSRHFSPSFKKSYKMMNLNEDKRHQISADPKNKVNLIQVFVNKPHTESHSNPSHHHTMIKKEYSPVMEPQVEPPMPPAPVPPPPVSSHLPAQTYPGAYPKQYYNRPPPLPHHQQQLPPSSYPYPPPSQLHGAFPPKPFMPRINGFPHPNTHGFPHPPPPHHFHSHGHHHHPNQMAQHPQYHIHEHVHPLPMMPNYGPPLPPPPFNVQPIKPWWARFGKPYFEPPQFEQGSMRDGRHPDVIIQSTKYPEQKEEDEEEHPVEEDTEEVVVVDQADADEGPHYSCLLPVSTGVCKAYEERYYFNKATVSCELFIYGGCGGNANNYATKRECEATCSDTVLVDTESRETSTLPDDTIIITSPVYVPEEAENTDNTETTPASVREEDRKEGKDLSDGKIVEEKEEEKTETQPDVKVEPVKLFHSSNTEYIIIITVMCFVGLSAVVLVALAIANLSRRLSKTKKEKVIEAVLSSHLDARSYGSVTPNRMSYYGHHPPSELGPPPISEVLKVHKDKEADEEM